MPKQDCYITAVGCVEHRRDAERLRMWMTAMGWHLVGDPQDAALCILVSCDATDAVLASSVDAMVEMAAWHQDDARPLLVVAGGLVQRFGDDLQQELDDIDAWIGEDDPWAIAQAVENCWVAAGGASTSLLGQNRESRDQRVFGSVAYLPLTMSPPPLVNHPQHTQSCVFSPRSIDDVLKQADASLAAGARELVLLGDGQHVRRNGDPEYAYLRELVARLVERSGLHWLRFHGWPVATWLQGILPLIREYACVVPYVDIPLWPLDPRQMQGMPVEDAVDRLRDFRAWEHAVLRTTVIAGQPNRSAFAFESVCASLQEMAFDHVDIWMEGCEEDAEERGIHWDEMVRRHEQLTLLQQKMTKKSAEALIGRTLEVLVDGASVEHPWVLEAHHAGQLRGVDGAVFLSFETTGYTAHAGELLRVEIEDASGRDFVGSVIDKVKRP